MMDISKLARWRHESHYNRMLSDQEGAWVLWQDIERLDQQDRIARIKADAIRRDKDSAGLVGVYESKDERIEQLTIDNAFLRGQVEAMREMLGKRPAWRVGSTKHSGD
jgi:hypothetical protein